MLWQVVRARGYGFSGSERYDITMCFGLACIGGGGADSRCQSGDEAA